MAVGVIYETAAGIGELELCPGTVTGKPVPGTEFTVKDGNGTVLGRYTTGKDGTVTVSGLVPGSTVVVSESKVPSGYVLNTTPQTIIVRNGSNSITSGAGGNGTNGTVTVCVCVDWSIT